MSLYFVVISSPTIPQETARLGSRTVEVQTMHSLVIHGLRASRPAKELRLLFRSNHPSDSMPMSKNLCINIRDTAVYTQHLKYIYSADGTFGVVAMGSEVYIGLTKLARCICVLFIISNLQS